MKRMFVLIAGMCLISIASGCCGCQRQRWAQWWDPCNNCVSDCGGCGDFGGGCGGSCGGCGGGCASGNCGQPGPFGAPTGGCANGNCGHTAHDVGTPFDGGGWTVTPMQAPGTTQGAPLVPGVQGTPTPITPGK